MEAAAPVTACIRLRKTAAEFRALAKRHAMAENAVIARKLDEVATAIEAEADVLERVGAPA